MRILKIKWETGKEDLAVERWIKNCLPLITDCKVLPIEVNEQ